MLGDRPRVDPATLSKADNEMLFVMGYECRRVGARGSRGKKSKYEEFDKAAGIEGLPRGTLQGRRLKARERLEPAFEAKFFAECAAAGMTLLTVAHGAEVAKYHTHELQLDGQGHATLRELAGA